VEWLAGRATGGGAKADVVDCRQGVAGLALVLTKAYQVYGHAR
jgi:hypothetical protein